jgi:peroxiredoxin/predicted 2-oxoglutarate/Fe(II)-dependent dioxygenase YbiX
MLMPGDPAPYFIAASSVNPRFRFDTVAGRYVVLSFFATSNYPASAGLLAEVAKRTERFDATNVAFFGVSIDPQDQQRLAQQSPGIMYFWDLDRKVSRLYGVVEQDTPASGDDAQAVYVPRTFVLDRALRVMAIIRYSEDAVAHVNEICAVLDSFPSVYSLASSTPAPVLIVPHVFEPELCRRLMEYYETNGGEDSGFMVERDGRTVGILDYSHKRRMDCEIADEELVRTTQERIKRRVVPAIRQAYQFHATRIERHIVACYDAAQGAHFRAHRDNTTRGTAHRRFAITINLNSPDYEGGEIWFPEFGPVKYKAPSGDAIVFSCSLLHEVPRVTKGKRYAFLPFLYDDAAAALRERNRKFLGDLSGAGGGGKVTHVCDTTGDRSNPSKVVLDGSAGCGNPEGCQTCLTAPTYQLGTTAERNAAPQDGSGVNESRVAR